MSNYRRCIKHAVDYHQVTTRNLELVERVKGALPYKKQLLAEAEALTNWVAEMEAENYHQLYVNSFIGMWSSFEAGLENVVADFLANNKSAAEGALLQFKRAPVHLESWPWDKEQCLSLAQLLERVANRSSGSEWWDVFARIKQLFTYINVELCLDEQPQQDLSEANAVRNSLLHRYGEVSEKDAQAFPALEEWVGRVVPFDKDRFTRYYQAISQVNIRLLESISSTHMRGTGNA